MTMRRSDREAMQKRNEFDRTVQRNGKPATER